MPAIRTRASCSSHAVGRLAGRRKAAPISRSPRRLIGMAQDGLASFEPAFADELSVIMDWGFRLHATRRRPDATGRARRRFGLSAAVDPHDRPAAADHDAGTAARHRRAPTGCASPARIARWSSPIRRVGAGSDRGRRPASAASRNVACSRSPRPIGCNAGWPRRASARDRRGVQHLQPYRNAARRRCHATAASSPPSTATRPRWAGSAASAATASTLGVEHFGQTGTIDDLYRHFGIDANAIIDAAESLTAGGPVRHRKMAV